MQINEEQLKKFILESGLVSRSDFDEAVAKAEAQKQKFGSVLLSEGKLSETDLKRITKGAAALVEADAYPGKTFQAVVAGISPATGAQFALIPPDNATGNFNKVVQWVPIRLNFKPGTDPNHLLRAGLSVRVKISSQNK